MEIPSNLDEAHAILGKLLSPEELTGIRESSNESYMAQFHHNLGRWIRNEWKLWYDGPLVAWFNERGIVHADDMSGIILDTFWCRLHEREFELDRRIQEYQEYWRWVESGSDSRQTPKIIRDIYKQGD